ncbi:MAG: hypothetical protein Q8N13_05090 [Acidovorax sp.]|nr:hypothetical protein [Acidovorax sp.]
MLCAVVVCIAAAAAGPQVATNSWFTLTGDPLEATKNLIEILPEPIGIDQKVVLDLRVSRDQQRTSFKGQKYRSYYAKAVVDCPAKRAWYLRLSYYAQPSWGGDVIAKEDYKEGEAEVLFKDMSPEWSKRLVSAACRVRNL